MVFTTTLTAACLAGLAATSFAMADDDQSIEHLQHRIATLESRLAEVEGAATPNWIDAARADEVRSLVRDVLADADTRSSLLSQSATAGWDNGIFIASNDQNFRLNVQGQMQFRYIYNRQSDAPSGPDELRGFENTRTQLIFTGHIVNPNWIYRVQGNYLRTNGRFELEEAYIAHVLGDGWTALAGQFRVPMLREFLVTEPRQQAIERSLVHQEFTAGRTQGVALDYRADQWHFTGGFTDGHPATGGFNSAATMPSTDFALTGRAEWLASGDWNQFTDFASWRDDEFGMLVGGAVHWQKNASGNPLGSLQVLQWTVDAQVEFGGANIFAYIVGRHLDAAAGNSDQYGAVLQGGYFLTDEWEVFGRFEWGDDDTSAENLSVITAGVNRFIDGHRIKWSADVGYGLEEVSATWGSGAIGSGGGLAGWRTDAAGEDGQFVVRSQIQLLF